MTDSQLIQLFRPIIEAGLIADGFTGVTVKQNSQPTQQGLPSTPTVFYSKINSSPEGMRGARDTYADSIMTHTENQYMMSTWQISAWKIQNPKFPEDYTGSDLAQEVSYILQSSSSIVTFANSNVGILKINNFTNPSFVNDQDQFSFMPSFTFTLTYQHTRSDVVPVITYPVIIQTKRV